MSEPTKPSVENLRRASRAVYLACEEPVARDISHLLNWAADEITKRRVVPSHVDLEKYRKGPPARITKSDEHDEQFGPTSPQSFKDYEPRLREALVLARAELQKHNSSYQHRTNPDVIAEINDVLGDAP